uniref:MBD domain-containing protein n=1 Tax=Strigamia maritima TaxID=126957 RepID=T1IK70_STRMM
MHEQIILGHITHSKYQQVIYLKNRFFHARLNNEIPYVIWRKRPLPVAHIRVPGSLAYVHIPKAHRRSKLEPRAWKAVLVGYAMGTRGYRIWDPILDDVYENKHLKVVETKVYKDVVDTYLGDSPLDISNGSETHSFNPNESSDDSHDDSSLPAPVKEPIISPAAPLLTQAPSDVTMCKKPTQLVRMASPDPIPPFKPRSKVERAPVPGKSGWVHEQVERQSGATAGQWDMYFYPPGQQVKLRSRPEVCSYCKNELNEPYVAADYNWKPSQKPVDTVVQEPSTEQAVVEPQVATDESDNNGTSEDSDETYAVRCPWDILRVSVINLDVHSHPESYFM